MRLGSEYEYPPNQWREIERKFPRRKWGARVYTVSDEASSVTTFFDRFVDRWFV
jgi:hypothetical protein